jgi:hypothetical protein
MRDQRAQMRRACRLEPSPRLALARDRRVHRFGHAPLALLVNGEQHLLLRFKVVVNRSREHPDRLGNIAHRGRVESALTEKTRRRVQ